MQSLRIDGGLVFDGSGSPGYAARVDVVGDRIVAVDRYQTDTPASGETLDAVDCWVCPGFIDAHSHSDVYLLIEPDAPSKLRQGITTEIVGNCGASAAPRCGAFRLPSDWRDKDLPPDWTTVAEYRELLAQVRPAVNVAMLVGHNNLRAAVLGYADQPATPADCSDMGRLLDEALDQGACGMSSGLVYPPGLFASEEEIATLARHVAKRGGIYTTHMRSESSGLLEAVDEALSAARQSGVRLQISHLKASGRRNWSLLDPALARIEKARCDGTDVSADRYPYTTSYTDLDIVLPGWAQEGGNEALAQRLMDAATCARMLAEMNVDRQTDDWGAITIASTKAPANEPYRGRPLPAVAEQLGMSAPEAVLHLCRTDGPGTMAFFHSMDETNMLRVLGLPWVMIGSDASLRAPSGPLSVDVPHPRAYGTFPRFLKLAREGRTVPVPEAIRKMTSLPADRFGLRDRGRLAVGAVADVVVLEPAKVGDTSTFSEPHSFAEGIRHMVVNGTVVLRNGRPTGLRSGIFLS